MMTFHTSAIRRAHAVLTLLALFGTLALVPAPWVAFAATVTMNGVGGCPDGTGWSTVACWNNGAGPVPTTGDDVVMVSPGPRFSNYDLGAGVQLLSLTLTSSTGDVIIAGGPIVLQSGGFIPNNWSNGGNNDFPGVTLNGPATFTNTAATSNFRLTAAITGTGPLTLTNTGLADGLQLLVASSYTGATTISGTSRARIDVYGAIPTGSALTVNGSALFQTGRG